MAPDPFGVIGRRQLLRMGGGTALLSAGLAACSSGHRTRPVPPTTTTSTTEPPTADVGPLRLASSLEHYLVGMYQTVAGTGLVTNPTVVAATRRFASQHSDHAHLFESLTSQAHGQPFTTANLAVADLLDPRLQAARTESDIVKLAYDIETMVAATYYSSAGSFDDLKLNASVMSVAAMEARHVAVLGMFLSGLPAPTAGVAPRTDSSPFANDGFQTSTGAIAPGTGV